MLDHLTFCYFVKRIILTPFKYKELGFFIQWSSKASKINTYVGTDGKIHFTNSAGADSVLNFSKGNNYNIYESSQALYRFVKRLCDSQSKNYFKK